jgi:hypothetical protein
MKKLIPVVLLLMFLGSSCARVFYTYVEDGKGGAYRAGQIGFWGIVTNTSYVEHCKPEKGALVCRQVKVNAPGIINIK